MTETPDVIIIGAGIVGVSTALHLQKRGQRVLLVDRLEPGLETSYGNSGILETSFVLPFSLPPVRRLADILLGRDSAVRLSYADLLSQLPWILTFSLNSRKEPRKRHGLSMRPLVASAVSEHLALMQGTDAQRYLSDQGRVKIHRSLRSFSESALERAIADELGVPFDVMDPAEFLELEPHILPHFAKAVCWTGSARLTDPSAVVKAYAKRLVANGGRFERLDVRALTVSENGTWSVVTHDGVINAPSVVMCAGPWADTLLRPLGYHFRLNPKRGYHKHYAAQRGATLAHAIVDADHGYLICPMERGYRVTTGVEFASLASRPNPVQLDQVLPFARSLFPLTDALDEKAWHGSRPCFPDSLPAVGRAPRHQGLWVNIGHGHSGMTIGPATGRLLAELMTQGKPFCDPTPYSPDRDMSLRVGAGSVAS